MKGLRHNCLILIVETARYVFWVILIACFGLLLKEIEFSVRKYKRIKKICK